MSQYADYSNLSNLENERKLKWIDEDGKEIVETTGLAASSKDSTNYLMGSMRSANRTLNDPFNTKGPCNPPS